MINDNNQGQIINITVTYDRPNRTIKTMAEFWATRQKPWDTTPLGSI